ncbi:BadF/BadG/BcrA/BcrD ATPase family protein [Alteromonas sp. CYL-A6]|uniref:BadF/BadG/BcrA/BcrD ATPase family protein n=1 Tax=Alteromonas nitratireducens TaxID=3390813 RepID=UPI0034A82747
MTSYYIGIDGGGTQCRAILVNAQGETLATAKGGPANIVRDAARARESVLTVCKSALSQSGLGLAMSDVVVCAGLAGANIPQAKAAFLQWPHPFRTLYVISDLHAACLGAHGGRDGAVLVCGTGSAATCFANGRFTDTGGHGFMLGDMASGAWLGLEAVRHTLMAMDALIPMDSLAQKVCEYLHVNADFDLVAAVSDYQSNDYAALAPEVVRLARAGDPASERLLQSGSDYLSAVATRMLDGNALPLAFVGGLSGVYQTRLPAHVQSRIITPEDSPEKGAVAFAVRQQTRT